MSDSLKIRFSRFIKKTNNRGIVWALNRLYEEILIPTTKISIVINKIIFFPIYLKKLLFPNISKNLYFIWDLRVAPVTFDFLWGVAIAKCYLEKLKLKKLHLIILYDHKNLRSEEKDYEEAVNQSMRQWRIYNLLISCCSMIKDIDFSIASKSEVKKMIKMQKTIPNNYYTNFPTYIQNKDYKILHNKDYNLSFIKINEASIKYCEEWLLKKKKKFDNLITISLRDYDFLKFRNSNLNEWKKVYIELKSLKFDVVVIPDAEGTTNLENYFNHNDIFLESKYNNQLRMGLYKKALVNLFVNGGASTPCIFSDLPYIVFKLIPKQQKNWSFRVFTERSFKVGQSPVFLKKNQMWVWDEDNYDVIEKNLKCFFLNNNIKTG